METNGTREGTGKAIYWVGGSKGGVGKSLVAMACIDLLSEGGENVLLVECDTSNADVWKAYGKRVGSELIDLDEADGWIRLVNVCDEQSDCVVVVNTASRSNVAVRRHGPTLDGALGELGRSLAALWVINRQRDSLELLREFVEAMPHAQMHVVRNGYFGDERKFELYNGSKLRRELVEDVGGKSITFPDLADRVADDLYSGRLALAEAAKTLPIGNRAELARWRGEVRKVLGEVVG